MSLNQLLDCMSQSPDCKAPHLWQYQPTGLNGILAVGLVSPSTLTLEQALCILILQLGHFGCIFLFPIIIVQQSLVISYCVSKREMRLFIV